MVEKLIRAFISTGQFFVSILHSIVGMMRWLGRQLVHAGHWLLVIGIPIGLIWYLVGIVSLHWQYSVKDDYRGAASIAADGIDQPLDREAVVYLDQNWSEGESLWFYNIAQGSNLLPYDFFIALEQKDNRRDFRDNANINRYRYLPQVATRNNPDALPVGMVRDDYNGQAYVGFTCAACHTSQINFQNTGIRIDGGPAASDMESFMQDMVAALEKTLTPDSSDPGKKQRFYQRVLARGNYHKEAEIDEDLIKFTKRLKAYVQINDPIWPAQYAPEITDEKKRITHYGFARLDAFGRIYNRVLQHAMDIDSLENILRQELPEEVFDAIRGGLKAIKDDPDQTHIVVRALDVLEPELNKLAGQQRKAILESLRSRMYNPANAPASYPFLWDIAQHDYVQWTGLVANGGLGPLGRNVGQVIGVFGTLEWQRESVLSLGSRLGGQGSGRYQIDFKSSINKVNLRRVENQIRTLQSPQWPQEILGKIDSHQAAQGEKIFNSYCVSCHKNIQRDEPTRRVISHITNLSKINTDPVLATNTINYQGYSGLMRNQYVDSSLGKLVIEKKMPAASLVKFSTGNVVTHTDPDRLPGFRSVEWLWGVLKALKDNPIKKTARQGNFQPAMPESPLAPLMGYKARSLNGIWATAPYLHNGSVPNLYELLLPQKQPGDPELDENGEKIEYRSERFLVGSREFDPVKVGFKSSGYEGKGFTFDTGLRGNSNAGHEYAAGRTAQLNGKVLEPLTAEQKRQLLEYLKSL